MIDGLYPTALDCGISPFSFWDMSIDEITDLIESHKRCAQQKAKKELMFNQILSVQIRQEILPLLVEKIPEDYKAFQLWDLFPELFKEEKQLYEESKQEKEFISFKEKRRAYAARINQRAKKVKSDDS